MPKHTCRLYLITPAQFEVSEFIPQLREAFKGGDVACLQLRLKNEYGKAQPDEAQIAAAKAIMPVCAEYGVQFILNDNPTLAKQLGADGVHVGEKDGSVAEARAIVGESMAIGCSCYDSKHRAMEAGEQDADYVAFGAFYETQTKKVVRHPEISILSDWTSGTTVPCVAIGGIKPDNLAPLVKAGADFIAAVTGVWEHPDGPKAGIKAYNDAIADAMK
jgi:thiamine-phosphate pyrophosphorylase